MCGVFALFLNRPLDGADIALGRSGTRALAHRGPDADGEWFDREAGVYLGHRRLAIIDPTPASDQPMQRDGVVICCNGEIYNYPALKARLQGEGRAFTTQGDVEVLLRAWQAWGGAALDRLDAMFAFALWDGRKGHLATDAFGEKPLFYAETADGLYVSSEIAPLARLLGLRPRLEGADLAAYLSLGFIVPPATAYPEIRRIGAARHLVVEGGRIAGSRTYWTHPIGVPSRGPAVPLSEADLDRFQEAFVESAKGRLLADVPACIFLSRGIDSTLTAAVASRDHGAGLKCLTVSFTRGGAVDEAADAAAIARHLGLEHETIVNDDEPGNTTPAAALDIFGQPNESVTMLSVLQMSRAAARRFKLALTGIGGDELTFGYGKNTHFYDMRRLYALPEWLRRIVGGAARPFAGASSALERLSADIGTRDVELYVAQKNFPAISWLRRLDGFEEWCARTFERGGPPMLQAPAFEWNPIMPGLRLVNFDHGSMRAGLELRTPFLSRRLVETVAEFDPRSFIAFGQKSVLRRLVERYVPKRLVDHPKSGFVFPLALFLGNLGDGAPSLPGLPAGAAAEIWRRRDSGAGWTRIATRLAIAAAFFSDQTGAS